MPERTAKPRPSHTDAYMRRRAWLIIGAVLTMAVLGPIALLTAMAAFNKPPPSPPAGFSYQGPAVLVADAWVAADQSPYPVAKELEPYLGRRNQEPLPISDVAWKGARFVTLGNQTAEAHRFTGIMNDLPVEITVVIGTDQNKNPVVMAQPTVLPTKSLPGISDNATLDYRAVGPQQPMTAGATKQLKDWAAAYVTDNRDALYKATGDSQARTYRGLPGKNTLVGDPVVVESIQGPNGPIARIRLTVIPEGWPPDSAGFPIEMDVLFGPFDREVPYIVAWGSAGDGPALTAYANGFTTTNRFNQPTTSGTGTRPPGTGTTTSTATTTTTKP